jgi:putative toxin-antitoxin system antitoxin component (TIGR02293 family)
MSENDVWVFTEDDKVTVAQEATMGVATSRFYNLTSLSGFNREALAPLMESSLKTISRYHEQGKSLGPAESEKVLMLERLFYWGQKVFESHKDFESWLNRPAFGLGGEIPFSLLNTISGIDAVLSELKNIATGNLS